MDYLKSGSIWVDKRLGTFHVLCYQACGKIYATGNVVRPKRNFKDNFIPIKEWVGVWPVSI